MFPILTKYTFPIILSVMTEFADLSMLKELFNARLNTIEAQLSSIMSLIDKESMRKDKEDDRQDEAIERLANRTTHNNETMRLTERVKKNEGEIEHIKIGNSEINYKVKVTWAVGAIIGSLFISILAATLKGWIGI